MTTIEIFGDLVVCDPFDPFLLIPTAQLKRVTESPVLSRYAGRETCGCMWNRRCVLIVGLSNGCWVVSVQVQRGSAILETLPTFDRVRTSHDE
jgi:hypothetical protein